MFSVVVLVVVSVVVLVLVFGFTGFTFISLVLRSDLGILLVFILVVTDFNLLSTITNFPLN